jgi:hypothetical protein
MRDDNAAITLLLPWSRVEIVLVFWINQVILNCGFLFIKPG